MRGHVRRRGARWELRVYVGRDPLTGRERYRTKTVDAGGKREAEDHLARFVVECQAGFTADGTFGQLVERWFAMAAPDWSPKTTLETRRIIDTYLRPLHDQRLERIRTADLDAFYGALRSRGGKDGGKLTAATVRRAHVVVRRALEQGVTWGWLVSNPAARASPGKVETPEIVPPSPKDVLRLLNAAEKADKDLAVFLVLAAVTGARRGELCALRWSDLQGGRLTLGRAIAIGPNGPVEKRTKTGKGRTIELDDGTAAVLTAHRARAAERALAVGSPLPADAFLFSHDPDGATPWRPDSTSRRYRLLRATVGLDTVRLHDLRHFVVTSLLTAGVDLSTVAGRVGHAAGGKTTLAVYGHFQRAPDRAAAELLARLVGVEDRSRRTTAT